MVFSLIKLIGGPIVTAITDSITSWVERKRIRSQAKIEVEHKKATADVDWDNAQVEASKSSWKDEFWTVVLAAPIVLAFIPGTAVYVEYGFNVLRDSTPDWYKAAVGVAISAAFGVRQFSKVMSRRSAQQVSGAKRAGESKKEGD